MRVLREGKRREENGIVTPPRAREERRERILERLGVGLGRLDDDDDDDDEYIVDDVVFVILVVLVVLLLVPLSAFWITWITRLDMHCATRRALEGVDLIKELSILWACSERSGLFDYKE